MSVDQVQQGEFILTIPDALNKTDCDEFIKFVDDNYDKINENSEQQFRGGVVNRGHERTPDYRNHQRDDWVFFAVPSNIGYERFSKIIEVTGCGLDKYIDKHPVVFENAQFGFFNPEVKYHRVLPRGGFHNWHCEWHPTSQDLSRMLVWHLSLSTHEGQGELEFLYTKDRIAPKAGQLVIWPAYYPWTHRGNAMKEGQKDYVTGWFYCRQG